MAKRAFIAVLLTLFGCGSALAQVTITNPACPYTSHPLSLSCLIPDFSATGKDPKLGAFNTSIAQVLGELPLAAPVSGVVIGFNKKLAVPEDITENLGTILTERGNTVGKYKLFAGFTYQRFVFDAVDGTKLSNLQFVFSQPATATTNQVVGYAQNAISANISQYTGILAFGITDTIDVSVIVPFERISASAGYNNVLEASVPSSGVCNFTGSGVCGPTSQLTSQAVAGSAKGFGDVILIGKATIINGERSKIAAGLETRFPTGDVFNLLGTGAYGFKPYVVFSRFSGRVTPHANFGYQWNSFSVLRLSPTGASLRLPDTLDYSAGVDLGLVPRKLSVVADLVGQHFFNAPRITAAQTISPSGANCTTGVCIPDTSQITGPLKGTSLKSIAVTNSDYNVENMSVGVKYSPKSGLIFSANALLKLNDAGLRSKFVPLVGISYRFGK